MKVILLERINRLGAPGDQVRVRPGFARNYLLPQKKALLASKDNIAEFESRRAEFEQQAADDKAITQRRAEQLAAMEVLTVPANVQEDGKLYGSVGPREIVDAAEKIGISIHKNEVNLPQPGFRTVGEYRINLILDADISVDIKMAVVPKI